MIKKRSQGTTMHNSNAGSNLSSKDTNNVACRICRKVFENTTSLHYGIGVECCWEKFEEQVNMNVRLVDAAQHFRISADVLSFPFGAYLLDNNGTIPIIMQRMELGKKKVLEILKIPLQKKIISLQKRNIPYRIIAGQLQVGESTIKRLLTKNIKKTEKNTKKTRNNSMNTDAFLPKVLTTDFKTKQKEKRNNSIILDYIRLNSIEELKKIYHCGRTGILRVLQDAKVEILNSQAKLKILNTMNIKTNSNSDKNKPVSNVLNLSVIENFQQARNFFHTVQAITDINQVSNLQHIINAYNTATKILLATSSPIENIELKKQLIFDYFHLVSLRDLQATYHQHITTIMRILQESGIETINGGTMNKIKQNLMYERAYQPINTLLEEILIGELLGDGNITQIKGKKKLVNPTEEEYLAAKKFLQQLLKTTSSNQLPDLGKIIQEFNKSINIIAAYSTAEFSLHKSILEYYWVKRIGDLFRINGYKAYIYTTFEKFNHKYRWRVNLRSNSSIQLKFLHDKWYTLEGRKIIPRDLKITPRILLHWYIGDGTLRNTQISLATYSFTREEVELLAEKIEMDTKIKFNVKKVLYVVHNEYREYWRLATSSKKEEKRFFDYISIIDDKKTLIIAKKLFPWKFNHNVRKREEVEKKMNTDKITKMYLYRPKSNRFFYAFRQSKFFLNHNKNNKSIRNFKTLTITARIKKNKV